MQRWMEANFGSVATMYEDRHQLWGFNHKGRLLQRSLPARRAQVWQTSMSRAHDGADRKSVVPHIQLIMQDRKARLKSTARQGIWSLYVLSTLSVVQPSPQKIHEESETGVRNTLQELGRLTGLRFYYSTALESIDFLAPLLERLFSKIGDAGDCSNAEVLQHGLYCLYLRSKSWRSRCAAGRVFP